MLGRQLQAMTSTAQYWKKEIAQPLADGTLVITAADHNVRHVQTHALDRILESEAVRFCIARRRDFFDTGANITMLPIRCCVIEHDGKVM